MWGLTIDIIKPTNENIKKQILLTLFKIIDEPKDHPKFIKYFTEDSIKDNFGKNRKDITIKDIKLDKYEFPNTDDEDDEDNKNNNNNKTSYFIEPIYT